MKRRKAWRISCDVGEVTQRLENELCYEYNYELYSFSNISVISPTSQLILQPYRCFTYVTAHSPTLSSHYLRHSSFSKPSVASPTSQLILQPFFRFSYVTGSSSGEPPMSRVHSPTFPSLHLSHSSFAKPSVALPTSQYILQPFRCFTYVTAHSPTLVSLLLRHRLFTWLAAHA